MRMVGTMLAIFGVGFGIAGLFFGRASWVGVNGHSIPVWMLLEALATMLLIPSVAIRLWRRGVRTSR